MGRLGSLIGPPRIATPSRPVWGGRVAARLRAGVVGDDDLPQSRHAPLSSLRPLLLAHAHAAHPAGSHRLPTVAPQVEVSGVTVVGVGAFNPAIFQPQWLVDKGLITANAGESAHDELLVTPELTTFVADWLSVQVTLQKAIFATVDEGRDRDLRDVASGVLDLLPETPIDAVGINSDAHYRVHSEEVWHELGDRFLPKEFWEPMFEANHWMRRPDGHAVGMRTLTVEVHRDDVLGFVRVEVAPSVRVTPDGVYAGVNAHFQLRVDDRRGNGYKAARVIHDQWDQTRALQRELLDRVMRTT